MPTNILPLTSVHYVQDQPAATWRIYHKQPGYPVVDVYVSVNNTVQKILPNGIVYLDEHNVDIEFSEPRAGFAMVVI